MVPELGFADLDPAVGGMNQVLAEPFDTELGGPDGGVGVVVDRSQVGGPFIKVCGLPLPGEQVVVLLEASYLGLTVLDGGEA